MKILLIGKNGQVGYELERSLQGLGEIIALDRARVDIAIPDRLRDTIRVIQPDLIVNAAAYTEVDKAEHEAALALRINAMAPAIMAEEAHRAGTALIHFSTDYVFDGDKTSPYLEDDRTGPVNIYGRTKLAGEKAVRESGVPHLILRTSWVYGTRGRNFLLTVRRLAATGEELRIVDDQRGAPTWCRTIAEITAQIVAQSMAVTDWRQWWLEKSGTYHLSARGDTSWYGFTQAILDRSALPKRPHVIPIATADYPTPAQRPMYSVLSCDKLECVFGLSMPYWERGVELCLAQG
jgi:dTDP-4-dehydrorhamnose reductase